MILALVLVTAVIGSGCFHATIKTGAEPSNRTIEDKSAAGFFFGLVPPDTVQADDSCKNGVATVETQHSFVNGLLSVITFGIFTPMSIKVTCAQ